MKKLMLSLLFLFFFFKFFSFAKASDIYYSENAVWVQDAGWPRLNKYSLNNLTKVVDDLTKNHIKYAIVMVGYYDGDSPTNKVLWQRTTTGGYMDGGPPNVTFYTSVVNALHAANITAIAWIEDTNGPIDVRPSNWNNLMSQINMTLQWGFDGYSDDIENINGTWQDYINWLNNVTVWLHSLGKLSMPAVGYDWRMDTNPYLHVDYIVTMFYGAASLFDPSNWYSYEVEAYWQENFGMYGGKNNPPASPVILGIMNFYGNTYPLAWQLDRAGYLIKKYGAPQLKGFSIWLYEYMGTNPTDWSQWNYWITHVNETYSPPLRVLNITTSPMVDVPMEFEGTNLYKLPYEPFYSPKLEYLFNGTVSITTPSQATQEIHHVLFGDPDHTGGSMGYSVYTYAGGPYNLTSSAEIKSVYFYCKATGNVKLAIYNATSYHIEGWIGTDYHPYALLTKSNPTSCVKDSWVLINVSNVSLQPGIYFIAIKGDTTGIIGGSGKRPEPVGGQIYGYNQFITESYSTDFKQTFPTVEGAMGGEPSAYVPTAPMVLINYNFSHWENGGINLTRYVDVNGNMTLIAYYSTSGPTIKEIFGKLKDRNNNPLQAKVIVYQEGTNNVVSSVQTDSNGSYNLQVFPGVYDVEFNLTNFFVKLLSINITQDISEPVGQISSEENRLSFLLESNYSNRIGVYSLRKPLRVKLNGTIPSWSYDENSKIVNINVSVIMAKSGYPQDIQAAVDAVAAAGGGTVYVPEGIFYWNGETVTIRGGVNVIGAGPAGCDGYPNFNIYTAKTILHNSKKPPAAPMFYVDGTNGQPVRISGIQFEIEGPEGTDTDKGATGIRAYRCINIRIDHCTFINFTSEAVKLTNTDTGTASGVIDHCVVDNPYKLGSGSWSWAYGFYVQGKATWWNDTTAPLTDFLGKYPVLTGYPVLYVEDCKISRTRHAVDAIQGGWIVARYNYIDHPYPRNFGQLEVHGSEEGSWPSARGFEFYNNTVLGETGYFAELTWLRGGAGVVFNNSFQVSSGYGIGLYRELCPQQPDEVLHNVWVWNNTMSGGMLIDNYGSFTENVDYFLRSPNQTLDGFTYTSYPYPHPLTLEK